MNTVVVVWERTHRGVDCVSHCPPLDSPGKREKKTENDIRPNTTDLENGAASGKTSEHNIS